MSEELICSDCGREVIDWIEGRDCCNAEILFDVTTKLAAANDTIKALRDDRQSLLNANAVMSYEISALRVGFCRLKEIQELSFPPDPDSIKSCQVALKAIERLANAAVKEIDVMMKIPKNALKDGEPPERN